MKSSESTVEKVAVVIPCYNEESSIAEVIRKFPVDRIAREELELTVYVIDNNSTDNTAGVARAAGAEVLRESRQGKGNALRTGFRGIAPDTDYVVMLDGDDTYSPDEILRVIEPLRSDFCDVVIGSRLGGRIHTHAMSKLNRLGNRLFTAATRMLYGANMTDVLTGYFAWKKPMLDQLTPYVTSSGFAVEMEMITKMAQLHFRMASVPIYYHPRAGSSHLHPFRDGCRILAMLLKNLFWRPKRTTLHITSQPQIETRSKTFVSRKIVFVSDAIYPYMKGGKEKRLYEITKRLAAMGHEVHIYTMHWWDGPDSATYEDGIFLHALCKRHNMYNGDRRTITEGLLFGMACFKLLPVSFDVLDVDHMPFFPIFSAWIVCTLRGRKLYATWHEALSHQEWMSYMGLGGIIASFIESISIRLPYLITAASPHTEALLASIHGRIKRVALVASGIDTSLLNSVRPASTTCDVLYVGRLVKDKNIDKLIAAIGIIARTNPEVTCLIIGQGPERKHLRQQITSARLQQYITLMKPLAEAADIYAFMKAAKVFCSPSVREGFGITTLEALGCGTPVVTVQSPGNAAQHLVLHDQTGSIVPLEPAALAEALLYWISIAKKPDIAPQLAANDWGQLAEKQAEVYTL